MVEMSARRDFAYDNAYNRALQSIVHTALEGTKFEQIHESSDFGLLSYSPPIPPRDGKEGETRRLIFASVDDDLAPTIADWLNHNPEVNIHEMPFQADQWFKISVPIGDRGSLQSGSPIVFRLDQDVMDEYGIESKHERPYWLPEYGTDVFFEQLRANIQRKYRAAYDEDPPDPPYFTGFELGRKVTKPLAFRENRSTTFIGSEWTFDYELQNSAHQRVLQLALNAGLGEFNGLGFGFMNRDEDVNDGKAIPQ